MTITNSTKVWIYTTLCVIGAGFGVAASVTLNGFYWFGMSAAYILASLLYILIQSKD